jgi:peptidyl-prolyl cis-trans isomerase B (cyclophilin B)
MPVVAVVAAAILALVPAKPFVRPDQPVNIRFVQSQGDAANKLIAALGPIDAAKVADTYAPASVTDLIDQSGLPDFALYTFDGKPVQATAVHNVDLSKGVVDLAAFYPQIRKEGTWILTWNSAQPLVISTNANPGFSNKNIPWKLNEMRPRFETAPKEQQQQIVDNLCRPVCIHLEPLVYAQINTDKGNMKATLDYGVAPNTVDSFIRLASGHFYDGSSFHRVIKTFMIQGGDSLEQEAGGGGPGFDIRREFSEKPHQRGALSMARTNDPDSAGSQFFIIHQRSESSVSLDRQYTVFGQVFEGLDIVDKIAETPVSDDNGTVSGAKPRITSIEILPATAEIYGIKK